MLDHFRAVSLDAMGTLIELRVDAQSTYYQILRALGHDEKKMRRSTLGNANGRTVAFRARIRPHRLESGPSNPDHLLLPI